MFRSTAALLANTRRIAVITSHNPLLSSSRRSLHVPLRPSHFMTQQRFFSTQEPREAEIISETNDTQNPPPGAPVFTLEDALTVRLEIIETLRDERVSAAFKRVARSTGDIMSRWNAIQNLLSSVTYQVLEDLTAANKVNLPTLGKGHQAAHNFNTIYQVIALTEDGLRLRTAMDEQWTALLEVAFDIDPALTRNAKISTETARKIAYMYLEFTKTEEFAKMVDEAMEDVEVAPDEHTTPAIARQLEKRQREQVLGSVLSPFLERVYSRYQYDGDEGFVLMQKALGDHFVDPEIVEVLNNASNNATALAGIPQN